MSSFVDRVGGLATSLCDVVRPSVHATLHRLTPHAFSLSSSWNVSLLFSPCRRDRSRRARLPSWRFRGRLRRGGFFIASRLAGNKSHPEAGSRPVAATSGIRWAKCEAITSASSCSFTLFATKSSCKTQKQENIFYFPFTRQRSKRIIFKIVLHTTVLE